MPETREVVTVGKHLTDKQRKKIIADYIDCENYSAVAKNHGISRQTVKKIVTSVDDAEINTKLHHKKEQNTRDVLAYMESKRDIVCEIIGKGLNALNSPDKLGEASPAQITTALGTLIDKFTLLSEKSGQKTNGAEIIIKVDYGDD